MALDYEKKYYSSQIKYIVGCDEAGRGCLLGPVFAAAVILPQDFECDLINDSKQLSEKKREEAFQIIIKNAIAYGISYCTPEEIDTFNILNASRIAMRRAMEKMNHSYDLVLTDCMKMKEEKKPVVDLVHGDAKAQCIAAASILAKVSRDHWCYEIDKSYPLYNIKGNKGYGTKDHLKALQEYGPVKGLHRFSYAPVKSSLIKKISLF